MSCKECTDEMCHRRGIHLPVRHAELCSVRGDYADLWDEIHGVIDNSILPDSLTLELTDTESRKVTKIKKTHSRRGKKPPPGLGDVVESALSSIGITQDRVEEWLGRPCRCSERKKKLNRLSKWATTVLLSSLSRPEVETHQNQLASILKTVPQKTDQEESTGEMGVG